MILVPNDGYRIRSITSPNPPNPSIQSNRVVLDFSFKLRADGIFAGRPNGARSSGTTVKTIIKVKTAWFTGRLEQSVADYYG